MDVFPNLPTSLKIGTTLLIISYEAERNLPKLSNKKQMLINYVEERLNYLSLLSIETVLSAIGRDD